ncbi:ATP-binding cassette domain-containing protein [Shewanella sp. JM162201]|uniref:ATP-binding cassette domain-containing protein n=1 Tax=Shewanella jiangmenensis TaxID=2837387 RepID=A0ABS5V7M8_9GAMM|nr:ATP-binding cassette domain-containing protein [Shewanella jiangmenensis]MBT1445714.1 ATP-binding cassette domain-containing protein [Shewanella jiangmenensis]
MLQLQHLTLGYADREIIHDLSVSFKAGEKVAILGVSGAGKSTLLNHIHGQLASVSALCAQSQGLVESLSLYHNIYMGALARHNALYNIANLITPFTSRLAEVSALCDALELDMPPSQLVSRLSGGQRQRVAIGRALYQQKPLFLGDEPVSALDPAMADRVLELIIARHETVIMVLHNRAQALAHFDRILGIADGRLTLDSPANKLSLAELDEFYAQASPDQVDVSGYVAGDLPSNVRGDGA